MIDCKVVPKFQCKEFIPETGYRDNRCEALQRNGATRSELQHAGQAPIVLG